MANIVDEDDHPNSDFKLKEYWEKRFESENEYEWLVDFNGIKTYILPLIQSKEARILIIGCGNSNFSADLYDAGYENITNIDFSNICILNMREKNANRPKMLWQVMDMTALAYPDQSFDVVIDKAGMDALMVDEGDVWEPNDETLLAADQTLLGISRVLTSSGIFIQITFAQTHFRTKYLMASHLLKLDCSPYDSLNGHCGRYGWTLSYNSVNPTTGCIHYFIYIMKK